MALLASQEMAEYCFHVVRAYLMGKPIPPASASIPNDPAAVFVTYSKTPHHDLRGCIGNFRPAPLHQALQDLALSASIHDNRFPAITLRELPALECTVSLLHSFEQCKAWDDWVIGTHGIRLRYRDYSATYLPSVAPEQGWDHIQTVQSLLRKAGYRGEVDSKVLGALDVERYQVSLASVKYSQLSF